MRVSPHPGPGSPGVVAATDLSHRRWACGSGRGAAAHGLCGIRRKAAPGRAFPPRPARGDGAGGDRLRPRAGDPCSRSGWPSRLVHPGCMVAKTGRALSTRSRRMGTRSSAAPAGPLSGPSGAPAGDGGGAALPGRGLRAGRMREPRAEGRPAPPARRRKGRRYRPPARRRDPRSGSSRGADPVPGGSRLPSRETDLPAGSVAGAGRLSLERDGGMA